MSEKVRWKSDWVESIAMLGRSQLETSGAE